MKKKEEIENIIRSISNIFNIYFPKIKGIYYTCIHSLLIFFCCLVLLFCNNIYYLIILLLIISLDSISIVFLHDCPLTKLEKKYLNISGKEVMNYVYKKAKVLYKCDHLYESQLELLINVWSLTSLKILLLIIMKYAPIKIIF